MATRALLTKLSSLSLSPVSSRAISSRFRSSSTLLRVRPLVSSAEQLALFKQPSGINVRCMSTQSTTSSLRDSSPNFSNRPPKETILLDGCDFEHWLVVMDDPPGDRSNPDITRDEIIDSYIKTLAKVVGSEDEARMKIYSVSTRHYFSFGANVSEELSYKIKELPGVRWVLPDSYLDVKNKDYGGEPFIDGQAVPYDPKYHEEWVRNNARANERSRRNDRPRNFDRSRNFERRREQQNFQNRPMSPPPSNFNAPGGVGPNVPPPPSNFNAVPAGPGPSGPAPPSSFNSGPGAGPNMPPPPSNFNNNAGPNMPPPPSNFNNNAGPNIPPRPSNFNNNAGPNVPPPNFNYNQPPPSPPQMGNAQHGAYRNQYGGPPGMNQNQQMPPNPQSYEGRPPYQRGPGGPPGYPGANPNPGPRQGNFYQGGNPNLNSGPGPYQGGGGPNYPGSNQSPPPPYQGNGNYQENYGGSRGNYQQSGPGSYEGNAPQGYQGRRDVPGRDY